MFQDDRPPRLRFPNDAHVKSKDCTVVVMLVPCVPMCKDDAERHDCEVPIMHKNCNVMFVFVISCMEQAHDCDRYLSSIVEERAVPFISY